MPFDKSEIIIYQTDDGQTKIDIKHIFEEGELIEDSVVRNFRTTAADGKRGG